MSSPPSIHCQSLVLKMKERLSPSLGTTIKSLFSRLGALLGNISSKLLLSRTTSQTISRPYKLQVPMLLTASFRQKAEQAGQEQ